MQALSGTLPQTECSLHSRTATAASRNSSSKRASRQLFRHGDLPACSFASYHNSIQRSLAQACVGRQQQRRRLRRGLSMLQAAAASAGNSSSALREAPAISGAGEAGYAAFDWRDQWYPVAFARDMPEGKMTQFTLFDEHYAVVRRPAAQGGPAAVADRCPHRAAALSQGLLTPDGAIQCAYHGWKFDGDSGECLDIPQLVPGAKFSKRTCVTAFPCTEHQGIVWLKPQPGGSTAAVTAADLPVLPEMEGEGWTSDDFVRDFDVDYTLIMENLMDPDHGLFAHQATYFDSYTANADMRMKVETGQQHRRPTIIGSVPGVMKFTRKPEEGKSQERALFSEKEADAADMRATIKFEAPTHVRWSRFDKQGKTTFITAFYAVPTGVGRCRLLLRYARSIAPWFRLPTWAFAIFMNNFLDQDTFLLASQQPVTLEAEAQGLVKAQHGAGSSSSSNAGDSGALSAPLQQQSAAGRQEFPEKRKTMFCYKAPSDSLLIQLGRWIDAAVPQMPNRAWLLRAAYSAGGGVIGQPVRHVVLDRWACHTELCPDSMAAFKTFSRLRIAFGAAAAIGVTALLFHFVAGNPLTGALLPGAAATAGSAAAAVAAGAAATQFKYVYTRAAHEKDLAKIPKLTQNLSRGGTAPGLPPAGSGAK